MRLCGDTQGEKRCSQRLYVVGLWGVHDFSDFLRDPSPAREEIGAVSRTGVDPAGVLHVVDVAYDSGGGDCAADYRDTAARVAGAIRQASLDCAMDAAVVVLRLRNRSDYLFHGVSDLYAEVTR